ncbi:MAG: tRNA (adenosine(37)-N6)-threonylcarbamoyltransferase complex ATPase subunit type 1 TsaE [Candidatus Omnitrophica bacterium]|nr:tRNA (adenosine(37)-N6)-threonylcarbamoyltransferase complex ATPase subunit type 1 TsaE [Candidatus Omnitrophota bacterium]
MFKITTKSAEDTKNCGRLTAEVLKPKDIIILEGELGAGKTTFVKGVLEGFSYKKMVLSPTFTLLRQYKVRGLAINHIDLYRIDSRGLRDLGLDEFVYQPHSLSFIEWGGKIIKNLDSFILIEFSFLSQNERKISFSLKGLEDKRLKDIKRKALLTASH